MIETVVSGAGGRLGGSILEHLLGLDDVRVIGAVVREGSLLDGKPVGSSAEPLKFQSRLSGLGPNVVLVETAPPFASMVHLEAAAEAGSPVVVASTGFDAGQRAAIDGLSERCPMLWAPNLSLGVAVLMDLVRRASKALPDYDIEIVEMHHARKVDAPSGTAWALASAAAAPRGLDSAKDAIVARSGAIGPRAKREIGIQTLRGGGAIGEHTVYLVGESERVELTHRASNRGAYAAGAAAAVRFLGSGQVSGMYTMADALGLDERRT
jgi:4-hydroxy-tetrahydrodipicolinate reductase